MPLAKTPFRHWAGSYVPLLYPGRQFFVNSAATNASDGNLGDSPERPLATLEGAFNHGDLTANNGDVIHVMPNHAETITGAGGITADIAGVTVVGYGQYNQRPRFLMDGGTTVDLAVSAADITFRNLVFSSGHADVVRCFNITAAGCWLDEIEFDDNAANENWLTPIKATSTTDNNADGLKVTSCRWISPDTGGLEFIEVNADLDGLICHDNLCINDAATAAKLILQATGKDLTNCDIQWNACVNGMTAGDLFIENDTAVNTGYVAHNRCKHKDVTTTHSLIDLDGVGLFDNLSNSTATTWGLFLPAIDTDA